VVVTIHQPEHLPWLGFFDKARQVDVFVILDHVQFSKHYFQNRNRIRTDRGETWLTVPVLTKGHAEQAIREVRINNEGSPRWREKCWTSMTQHYRNTPHWLTHAGFFENLYRAEWVRLVDLNEAIIRYLLHAFSIPTQILKSSDMKVEGVGGDLLLNICRKVGSNEYLSGVSGRDYLNPESFAQAGVAVRFQEFHHPIYSQAYEPFLPCMSAIDLLFNYGPSSRGVLEGIGVKILDHVFH